MNAIHRRVAVVLAGTLVPALLAAPARSAPVHQVTTGESLWSVAAANGMPASTLAAANGLGADASVHVGQVLTIPAAGAGQAPAPSTPVATPSSVGASSSAGANGSATGGYLVRPGDSLGAIAARQGVSVSTLAATNGLDVAAPLLSGTRLQLPAGGTGARGQAGSSGSSASSASAATTSPTPAPGVRVDAGTVGSIASSNGVPASLAQAIAWQESGLNQGAVSGAGARGVMQVMPETWGWVGSNLSSRGLDPASATDNVHAGTLYLGHLLRQTGGDPEQAAAAYYQGLSSVRSRGMYDDTKQYVRNVMSLRSRFGG
ncbi:MAG: LysM peptidoglycan-binding domain-containing protein [Solirubrobacteraceae bacterium]